MLKKTCPKCGADLYSAAEKERRKCPYCGEDISAVPVKIVNAKITVPGRPVPKERPRTSAKGRRMYIYTPSKTSKYEKIIGYAALDATNGRLLEGDLEVYIKLYFKDRRYGDIDNCAKSILDGLQGTVFKNDKQVARLIIERCIDKKERAEIIIRSVKRAGVKFRGRNEGISLEQKED